MKNGEIVFTILKDGLRADIEWIDEEYHTSGFVGNNQYKTINELLKGLQGFNISIDDLYNL